MDSEDIIRRALEEDIGPADITSQAIIPDGLKGNARIVAKQELILAGIHVASSVFLTLNSQIKIHQHFSEGDFVRPNDVILGLEGPFQDLLKGERVALNFLGRLCGIATMTREYVQRVGCHKTKILDTRKTIPTLRDLEKYAVRVGGGTNHRMGLYDQFLIKDNHIRACGGSVTEAIVRIRKHNPTQNIVVEITHSKDVETAAAAGATRLLLDNMSDDEIGKCVGLACGRIAIEVSGGITCERVEALARMGVDYISVGALTHSPKTADLSMDIEPV